MAKDSESCPPLPAGSVSLNKLHDAAKKGADLEEALEGAATTKVRANAITKPEPAEPGTPAVEPPAATDTAAR